MPATVNAADLPPDVRAKLNIRKPRERKGLDAEGVRAHALRVLATLAELTRAERARVLTHAQRVNKV